MDKLKIHSLNISTKKGITKTPTDKIILAEGGIIGDAHFGTGNRQISLLGKNSIDKFKNFYGLNINFGDFAENITIEKIPETIAVLDKFTFNDIELQVTQIGKKCHGDTCAIFKATGNCIMPKEGIFCKVIKGGKLKTGDELLYSPNMISVKDADFIINENILKLPNVECDAIDSCGEVLRENIFSDRDQPPFHRVMMDGIAIDINSWEKGQRTFIIKGLQKAGDKPLILENSNLCIEVMTGAVLPEKTNCVIRFEDIEIINTNNTREATIKDDLDLKVMQFVHKKGSDNKKDDLVLESGKVLLPPQIALAISVGKSKLLVSKKPSIAIISTGDELVDIGQEPEPYQIRMSNSHTIYSILKRLNYQNIGISHIIDDKKILLEKLSEILEKFDIVILSGGVSMGKFDYVPTILKELGVKKLFHKIKEKPGKPLWFGKRNDNKVVFGLPGNPISSLVCFYRYVLPFLKNSLGEKNNNYIYVQQESEFKITKGLTNFIPVKLTKDVNSSDLFASQVKINNSGDFTDLANSDGFIELDSDYTFDKDKKYLFYSWKI